VTYEPRGGRRAYAVWLTGVAVYFLAVFHRSSLGVAGIAAAQRFDISAAQLSTFTMLQLLVYALMQVPVGVMIDRFGPQRLLLTGVVLMTVAQLGFAFTGNYYGAVAARICVGIGDAMVFVSVLRIIASWFPRMRGPVITQFTSLLGQLGSLTAALPLAASLSRFGWTTTFAASAALGVALGVLVLLVVRDVPPDAPPSTEPKGVPEVRRDVRLAWRDPGTRLGLWSHFTTQFATNVLALLWGFPFFVQAQHTGERTAALLLSLLVVTMMVGGPFVGAFIARHPWERSTLVMGIVTGMATIWAVVLLWPGDAPVWVLALMVVATGLGAPGSMVGFDVARTFTPSTRLGTATGIVNIGGFAASLLVVLAIGVLLDVLTPGSSTDYAPRAFDLAMSVQYVAWSVGLIQIYRYRRKARAHLARTQPETYEQMTRPRD
jgi:MFS family permease